MPPGDDPANPTATLPEHLDTFVNTLMAVLAIGITSDDGITRLELLRELLERGASGSGNIASNSAARRSIRRHSRWWPTSWTKIWGSGNRHD